MMGRVSINNGGSGVTTAVSNAFIESYMTDASDVQLKVYLYLLYAMNARISTNIPELSQRLHYSESEILLAIRYWENKQLIFMEFNAQGELEHLRVETLIPETRTSSAPLMSQQMSVPLRKDPTPAAPVAPAAPALSATPAAPKRHASDDKKRREILSVIEQYIGKPLSVRDVETVDFIREDLQFSDTLTDYLVQYCVELGKKSFSYIRTVAVDWHERGIATVESAVTESERFKTAKRTRSATNSTRSTKRSAVEQYKNYPQNQYDFAALEARVVQN